RRWERELGVHLLGDEALVVASPRAAIAPAMGEAGAAWRSISRSDIAARLPFCGPAWGHGPLDPAAGSLRLRPAPAGLASQVEIRRAEVVAVADGVVSLADGSTLESDAVLVCAGRWTPVLTGFDFGATFSHHVRLTYAAGASAACLIAPEGY